MQVAIDHPRHSTRLTDAFRTGLTPLASEARSLRVTQDALCVLSAFYGHDPTLAANFASTGTAWAKGEIDGKEARSQHMAALIAFSPAHPAASSLPNSLRPNLKLDQDMDVYKLRDDLNSHLLWPQEWIPRSVLRTCQLDYGVDSTTTVVDDSPNLLKTVQGRMSEVKRRE